MGALAARHRDTPFDLVYERYSLWARAGSAFARRHRLPHLVEVNSPLRAEQRRYRALAWDARAARVEQVVMGGATAVVAVSDEVARYVRSRTPRPDSVHVVENGVDLARYADVAPYVRGERFQVGFLGSLKPWHGVDVLIAAAAIVHEQVPDLSLLVVGDGPERASLERLAHERGLGDVVQFTGSVPKRDVPARLATMDVAVAPYPQLDDFYFSPLKVYDYLAAGRAIVASRVGQIPHVLRDGDTAVLVRAGSVGQLASALLRLHRSPALAERLGRAARADAVARHGWDAKARHILGLAARHATPATHLPTRDALSWHAE
jgi:glycosyltransferase involved in cell wall biosynthesis